MSLKIDGHMLYLVRTDLVVLTLSRSSSACALDNEHLLVHTDHVTVQGHHTRRHAPLVKLGRITVDLPKIQWEGHHFNSGTLHEYIELVSRPTNNLVRAVSVFEEGSGNGTVIPFGHHWWGDTAITAPGLCTRQYCIASIKPRTEPEPTRLRWSTTSAR